MDDSFHLMIRLEFEAFFVGVALEDTLHNPIFRDIAESVAKNPTFDISFFFLGVESWTLSLLTVISFTLNSLVIGRMILLLLPSVTHVTVEAVFATTVIVKDEVLGLPVDARLSKSINYDWFVKINIWFPPVVLPIVSIHTF